ncbi:hypothetical protein Ate02nite_94450 [Paractinoplanes tereljensis]|uniref:Diguanylate cyclase n=1 Tax=Paractinoplanes tereljensis TaxID=571912 RepID=A0A919NYS3_9ACTN|nr:hypothetical protein Ate02nite_94450 [Actinoplanes tereljensis]
MLYPHGLVGHAPWILTMLPFVLFGTLQQPAVLALLQRGPLRRIRSLGPVLHILVVVWIIYVLGWGPVLPLAFALVVTGHFRAGEAPVWRTMLVWSCLCIAAGQAGIALGWIFCYLPPVPAQVAGLLGAMLTAMFIRLLGRAAEQRESAEAEVRRVAAHFRELVQDSTDVIAVVGPDHRLAYLSPAIRHVTGFPLEFYLGSEYGVGIHEEDHAKAATALADTIAHPGVQQRFQMRLGHADGGWRWVEASMRNLLGNPDVRGIVITFRDVTEHRAMQEQLAHEASHDHLTGLVNRAAFLRGLAECPGASVLFIDLNGFKQINDAYGHRYGDAILVATAAVLDSCVRGDDLAGRLGGDEFGVVLTVANTPAEAVVVAERILAGLDQPVLVDGTVLHARASIGVAVAGPDAVDPATLLHRADTAMYYAKRSGGHTAQVYFDGMLTDQVAGAVRRH